MRENLTLWDPTVPEADVVQAARDACIHDDIARAARRLRQPGRGGRTQLQRRPAPAAGDRPRAGRQPALLVLDEATSALDPTTEKQIDENLRRRGCTCLIVAHRLSTIRDCDEIIVLERGKVVQRGTHDELKDVEGPYARLIAS